MNISDNKDLYIISRWMYSIGEPIIEDAEYNNLHRLMLSTNELPEYSSRSWSSDPCPLELLKKYNLESKAHSITLSDRTESIPSLVTEYEVFQFYGNLNRLHYVSYKHDGFNVQTTYYNGHYVQTKTRGRSSDALDISNAKGLFPETININERVVIVGELTLSKENFNKLKLMFPEKNLVSQRSAVRTALANKDAHSLLTFTAFNIMGLNYNLPRKIAVLEENGFATPQFTPVTTYVDLLRTIKNMGDFKDTYIAPTDGVVVADVNGDVLRAVRIGQWEESIYKSYVVGYEEEFGPHSLSLKILIKPIRLTNSTQRRVTITNISRVIENNLLIGKPIAFVIKSDATADLEANVTKMLQKEYEYKEDEYRYMIDRTEEIKNEQ